MTPSAREWLSGLATFVDEFRRERPLPLASSPPAMQAAQRAILATHLTTWLEGEAGGLSDSHAIAFTTSEIGIGVADEVLSRNLPLVAAIRPRLAVIREIEYRLWTKDHPDLEHAVHVNHWSWIKAPVPVQRGREFHQHPLREGEALWLHRTGTSGPGVSESRHAHLWKWTGEHAVLLEPFIKERVDAL
jgi:hypothetical protein